MSSSDPAAHTTRTTSRCGEPWLEDPRLLSLLPLIYVAWADGDLEGSEVARIREALAGLGLDERTRGRLERWLDPGAPPSVRDMTRLLATIRLGVKGAPGRGRGLADLGIAMAKVHGLERTEEWASEERRAALERLEEALGLAASDAARELVLEAPPPRPRGDPVGLERPTFDVPSLTLLLDEPHGALRRSVFALLADPMFERPLETTKESYRETVKAWLARLADAGLGALAYPGVTSDAKDLLPFIAVFETLAYFDLSLLVKFGVQFGLFGGSILSLGAREQHERWLPAVARGETLGCFAMTELGHGSNVRDLGTSAVYDRASGEFVLHTPSEAARKDWIGNAARHARFATVFAQLEVDGAPHGVHAFVVPIRDERGAPLPGVTTEDCGPKLGLNGVDNGRIRLERVRVPRENLLRRFGEVSEDGTYSSPIPSASKRFFTMIGTLVGGRVSVACAALSVAKSALTIAVRYGSGRRQFGAAGEPERTLLDYPAHQHRLVRPLATAYALHFALRRLAARYAARTDQDALEVESLAAGLKVASTRFASDCVQACREACGAQGYAAENRFAALRADCDVFTTFEGDNTVLLQLVARGLLTGYRRQFSSMGFTGVLRHLAERAAQTVLEQNPITVRRWDEGHLRDRAFHLGALRAREAHLTGTLARRLQKRIAAGADPFDASSECQLHMLALARGHVERLVLEHFDAAVAACADDEQRRVLSLLRDLHALDRIDADAATFIECGILESGKARAIRKLAERLTLEARGHALSLVNAFGIPDAMLGAPIAFSAHFERGG